MPTEPLGTLLSNSLAFAEKHWKQILVGALIFGAINGVIQLTIGLNAKGPLLESVSNTMGVDLSLMQQVMQEAKEGVQDSAAIQEFMEALEGTVDDFETMTEEERGAFLAGKQWEIFTVMLPTLAFMTMLILFISHLAAIYFYLLTLEKNKDIGTLLKKLPSQILPLLGLWLWIFLRTFIWIPFIGILIAIILGPRFICAPVYLIQEKKGIFESARISYSATKGYWGKIVGNIVVLMICFMIARFLLFIPLGMIGIASGTAALVGNSIIDIALMGIVMIFYVNLALTIMSNPKS